MFWLDKYHVDGLRVDAVASMLYLDYSRKAGRVDPQRVRRPREPRGDRVPAAAQRERLPRATPTCRRSPRSRRPGRWSRGPTYVGGLGFGLKWDMGWMHDTLRLLRARPDPPPASTTTSSRSAMLYAFTENFVLPLSHDEVVHGKGSLLGKMPGDDWQKFANLRLLYALHVGAAGQEAAVHGRRVRPVARVEPRREPRLAPAATTPPHAGIAAAGSSDLNRLYRERAGAARARLRPGRLRVGRRQRRRGQRAHVPAHRRSDRTTRCSCVFNFTPVPRHNYRVGVPRSGLLARAAQQRRRRVRRQRPGQPRRRGADAGARRTAGRTR